MLDVITLGETMIRLSPKNYERIEQASQLDFRVGGSESNVAVALSRLGLKAGWVSKLTDNALGKKIANEIRRWNVNTDGLVWTPKFRIGTYYAEFGSDPRPTNVIYDRKSSAMTSFTVDEVDWNYLSSCKLFHTSGITVALSQNCENVVKKSLEFMKEKGKTTSFDINYRSKLWSVETAKEKLNEVLPNVDILISSENDIDLIFGVTSNLREKSELLLEKFSLKLIALTRGPYPSYALDNTGNEFFGQGYRPNLIDRIGAGDAFDAGFLFGFLLGDIAMGIQYGEAMSALKFSIPGDFLIVDKKEIEDLIKKKSKLIKR